MGDGTLIYGPTWLGPGTFEKVEAIGTPRLLVLPNHYHHLSLARFRERYPDAGVVAGERALARLDKKGHRGVRSAGEAGVSLAGGVELVECPGCKSGELWVTVEHGGERTWLVGDAFFCIERPLTGLTGAMLRLLQIGRGLRIGQTFRWLVLDDEATYRRWLLSQLAAEPPTRVGFCHGEMISGDGVAERLVELAERRLRA